MTDLLDAREAEQALLGAILLNPAKLAECGVTVADLSGPGHALILDAVQTVLDRDGHCDELLVFDELRTRGTLNRIGVTGNQAGAYLHDLITHCPAPAAAPYYASQVREAAKRRTLDQIAQRIHQAVTTSGDIDDTLTTVAELALHAQLTVDETDAGPVPNLHTLEDLVAGDDAEQDWVIPGFLERMDRFILTGPEGHGKSVLTRMLCVMVAAGRDPFHPGRTITPQRTLIVDLENSPGTVRRNTRPLVARARNLGIWNDGHAFVWLKPSGLDLRSPGDVRLLDQVLTETRPALVGLGPLYKAYTDRGDSHERIAGEVARVLDQLREKHRIAWFIEAHLPKEQNGHRPISPIGSSLWTRWPEFCRTMVRVSDDTWELIRPRGDRETRDIPLGIRRGGDWPWTPLWDPDEIEHAKEANQDNRRS